MTPEKKWAVAAQCWAQRASTVVTRPRIVALRVLLLLYRCKLSSDSIQSVVPRSAFSFFFGCRQYDSICSAGVCPVNASILSMQHRFQLWRHAPKCEAPEGQESDHLGQ